MNALAVVDIQYDFLPGGALAVQHGEEIIPIINRLMSEFEIVVATQDFHPADHLSFASQHPGRAVGEQIELLGITQILWPDHCVAGTHGSELVHGLRVDLIDTVIRKGTDRELDSYSGFFDNAHRRATGLESYLREHQVDALTVAGLATDYCVKFTALDAIQLGFPTTVVTNACRGVDLIPGDVDRALEEMALAGVSLQEK